MAPGAGLPTRASCWLVHDELDPRRHGRTRACRLAQPALEGGDRVDGAGAVFLGASLLLRGIVVGRGPWGNMFEFTVAFSFSMLTGYLLLARRYAIRSIGFIPLGVALALLFYLLPAVGHRAARPALHNAPLLTIHVGMAVISYGIFATSFAAGVAYLVQGKDDPDSPGRHWLLDEVAYRAVIIGFPIFATMIILAPGGPRSRGRATGAGTRRRPRRS